MNHDELDLWREAVFIHCKERDELVNDRREIKSRLEAHLKKFFSFDEIVYCDFNFNKIELKFDKDVSPVIPQNIGELGMEWIISTGYDNKAFSIIVIEIYPFGINENEMK